MQFFSDGKLSEVWIEDQRPDGAAVMLVCGVKEVDDAARLAPGPSISLVTSTAPGGDAFPILRELGLVARVMPKVHVDTTNMPGGIQRFFMSIFGRKAMDVADQGVRMVAITPATAKEWGWIPEDYSASPSERDQGVTTPLPPGVVRREVRIPRRWRRSRHHCRAVCRTRCR